MEAATLGFTLVMALTMAATLAARMWLSRASDAPDAELVLYQVAMLAGGPRRVADTALSYLTWSGVVEVRESTNRLVRRVGIGQVPDLHPVEWSALAAINPEGVRPEAALGAAREAARQEVDGLDGLVVDARLRLVLDLAVVLGCGGVVLAAIWWMLASQQPTTGFVPLLAVTSLLYMAWWSSTGRPRVTGEGEAVLEQIRSRYDADLEVAALGVTSLSVERAMHLIALYGRDALTGGLSGLRKVLTGSPAPVPIVRSHAGR